MQCHRGAQGTVRRAGGPLRGQPSQKRLCFHMAGINSGLDESSEARMHEISVERARALISALVERARMLISAVGRRDERWCICPQWRGGSHHCQPQLVSGAPRCMFDRSDALWYRRLPGSGSGEIAPSERLMATAPSLVRLLFRRLLRTVRDYDSCQLPCMVQNGSLHAEPLTAAVLRGRFRLAAGSQQAQQAAHALSGLRLRLQALQAADTESRSAMSKWHALLREGGGGSAGAGADSCSAALEDAALLLFEVHGSAFDGVPPPPFEPPEEPDMPQELQRLHEAWDTDPAAAARRFLDDTAAGIRRAHPALFPTFLKQVADGAVAASAEGSSGRAQASTPSASAASGTARAVQPGQSPGSGQKDEPQARPGSAARLRMQVDAISGALFRCGRSRLRHDAFEWVYDGLEPLLLPEVLRRRRGVPLALALAFCGVARRLSLSAVPIRDSAPDGQSATDPEGFTSMATKHMRKAVVAAPPPDLWLVACAADGDGSGNGGGAAAVHGGGMALDGALFVDTGRRLGEVMDWSQLRDEHPDAASQVQAWGIGPPTVSTVAAISADLVRAAMVAHQRRGESDAVTHYLYQLLALDPVAPEWQRALAPPEVMAVQLQDTVVK